jgi:DNA polymerase III subunit beta
MRIKIEKSKLFDLLQKVYAFVPAKSSLQILSNIKFLFNNGKLEIAATDLDHSIRVFTMIDGEGSFEITVNARKVYDIIREIHDGIITITKDENVLIIESESGFSCKIAGTDSGSFPGFPEIKVDQECILPVSQLKTMVLKSSFAVAKDDSRAVLCGVLLEVETKK